MTFHGLLETVIFQRNKLSDPSPLKDFRTFSSFIDRIGSQLTLLSQNTSSIDAIKHFFSSYSKVQTTQEYAVEQPQCAEH